jgi:hypothetical protein
MNERINELARQAGFEHPDHVGTCEIYAYFDHKKFALLIVQECLLALEPDWYASEIEYNVEQRLYHRSADIIKRHFGIDKT